MTTFAALDGKLTGRNAQSRKLANNTYAERRGEAIAIRLHQTDILTFHPFGAVEYNTGGWLTTTTKARMNEFGPVNVWSVKGRWYFNGNKDQPYADGTIVSGNGVIIPAVSAETVAEQDKANAAIGRKINNFLRKITPAQIVKSIEETSGDCFLCRWEIPGDGQTDHLLLHLEENYLVGHMIYNAVKAQGYVSPDTIMSMIHLSATRGTVDSLLSRALRKYLRRALISGVAVK